MAKKFLDLNGLKYFKEQLGQVQVVDSLPTSATNANMLYITNCVGSADKPFLNNTYISKETTPLYLIFGQDDKVILGSNGEYYQYTYTYSNNIIKINTFDFTYDKTNNTISVNGKIFSWYDASKNIVAYWYQKYGAYIEINGTGGTKEYKNIFDFYTRKETDELLDGVVRNIEMSPSATTVTKSGNTITIPSIGGISNIDVNFYNNSISLYKPEFEDYEITATATTSNGTTTIDVRIPQSHGSIVTVVNEPDFMWIPNQTITDMKIMTEYEMFCTNDGTTDFNIYLPTIETEFSYHFLGTQQYLIVENNNGEDINLVFDTQNGDGETRILAARCASRVFTIPSGGKYEFCAILLPSDGNSYENGDSLKYYITWTSYQ